MTEATLAHRTALLKAKQKQRQNLRESAAYLDQLAHTFSAIVKTNSVNEGIGCPSVLDKITTIHDLDKQIDRQLNCDISASYEHLVSAQSSLARGVKRVRRGLAMKQESRESFVDLLQQQAEQLDQELRILEMTLAYVREHEATTASGRS